jgi:uncharacterized protein YbbC (DUF1343 family)
MRLLFLFLINIVFYFHCIAQHDSIIIVDEQKIIKGNQQLDRYLPLIKNKKVGIVANAASLVNKTHLVDTLLRHNILITKIFSPEHGFRGNIDAGEKVNDTIDNKTGIPIISLYGKHKMPTEKDLQNVDVVVFDLQDVGVRFYTYISTLYYVIKSCALFNKPLIILDRPNPNGFYIDGPVLDTNYRSFLGIIPIPLVYGMTIGELALMINQEPMYKPTDKSADIQIIQLKNYTHNMMIKIQSIPSPNLNSWQSIILYPSLGLFEGTVVSVGRGTDKPFQILGHPKYPDTTFCFVPKPNKISKNPKYANIKCCGIDLSNDGYLYHHPKKINLQWLIHFYQKMFWFLMFCKNELTIVD